MLKTHLGVKRNTVFLDGFLLRKSTFAEEARNSSVFCQKRPDPRLKDVDVGKLFCMDMGNSKGPEMPISQPSFGAGDGLES